MQPSRNKANASRYITPEGRTHLSGVFGLEQRIAEGLNSLPKKLNRTALIFRQNLIDYNKDLILTARRKG
jgi:hypothetical protein